MRLQYACMYKTNKAKHIFATLASVLPRKDCVYLSHSELCSGRYLRGKVWSLDRVVSILLHRMSLVLLFSLLFFKVFYVAF